MRLPLFISCCLVALLPFTVAQKIVSDAKSKCSSIANSFDHPNVRANFAEYISAGTNISLEQNAELATCGRPYQSVPVDLCRVAMFVETSSTSNITLEAWLPSNWTGRFLSTGNGGLSGCIQYEDIAYGTSFGFATVGANNGHNGTSGEAFYNAPEVVADFAYRSVHTGVVVGKDITKSYYGDACSKSYYLGCSTGGRQGFKEVQDFPSDFDGVVVGAPALAFNNLSSWSGSFYLYTGSNTSDSYLTPDDWALVHQDILSQCDSLDGAVDGILEDPELCAYTPVTLQCSPNPANKSACLTSAQVETVKKVFSPLWGWGADNQSALVYPRMQPGSELADSFIYYSGNPFPYTEDWYQYAILDDPSWSAADLNNYYIALAATKNPSNIETWKGDLSAFKDRGGKILHYHGQMDSIITSANSPRYYEHVSSTMGLPPQDLDDFYRFFRIAGMDHCSGGDGAWQIGQTSLGAAGTDLDPQHNILLRMIDWVENGAAPETVTGVKFNDDIADKGVDFTRNHCRYPLRNQCVDPENYKEASAWKCVL